MHKKIGGSIYVHKSNMKELEAIINQDDFKQIKYIKENLLNEFDLRLLNIVKKIRRFHL